MNASQFRFLLLIPVALPLLILLSVHEHVTAREFCTELASRYRDLGT